MRLFVSQAVPALFEPAAGRNDPDDQNHQGEIGQDGGRAAFERVDGDEDLQCGVNEPRIGHMIAHRLAPVARDRRLLQRIVAWYALLLLYVSPHVSPSCRPPPTLLQTYTPRNTT